jgi:GUN4-like
VCTPHDHIIPTPTHTTAKPCAVAAIPFLPSHPSHATKRWPRFFKAIDWVVGENNVYRKWPAEFKYNFDAPKGHMPLTNALRGTQLFQAIMEHPAIVTRRGAPTGSSAGAAAAPGLSIDERSASAARDTLKF